MVILPHKAQRLSKKVNDISHKRKDNFLLNLKLWNSFFIQSQANHIFLLLLDPFLECHKLISGSYYVGYQKVYINLNIERNKLHY